VAFIDKTPVLPEFKINLPLYVGGKTRTKLDGSLTKRTKRFWLTLNNYRNWHYQTASDTKVLFKAEIKSQVDLLPVLDDLWDKISLEYVMYPPNNVGRDLGNTISIMSKYFEDALVELGKLKDDNNTIIPAYSCRVSKIDKTNPRVEVFIRPFFDTI